MSVQLLVFILLAIVGFILLFRKNLFSSTQKKKVAPSSNPNVTTGDTIANFGTRKIYKIRNVGSDKYIGIEKSSAVEIDGDAAKAKQRDKDSESNKEKHAPNSYVWYFEKVGSNYRIRTMHGMYAMKIYQDSTSGEKGVRLRAYENYSPKQSFEWKITLKSGTQNHYYIKNLNSGRFLAPSDWSSKEAKTIVQKNKDSSKDTFSTL